MVASTPSSALPYPESADMPQVNVHLQNLATAADQLTIPRYSNSSARSAGIPTPNNGQAAYLQSTEQLGIYKSTYGTFMDVNKPSILKIKTGSDGVVSSTTFRDDSHLIGFTLKASTWYLVRGVFWFNSPAAADMKFILIWSGSSPSASDSFWCMKNQRSSGAMEQRSAVITAQIAPATDDSTEICATIEGIVLTSSPAPTTKVQFAQFAASGTSSFRVGSYLEFIEAS